MQITIVAARAEAAEVRVVTVPDGATVRAALEAAGLIGAVDADSASPRVGMFARRVSLASPLRDGDRVELYRPLRVDPKEARRRRVEKRSRAVRARG